MDIPSDCADWARAMRSSEKGRAILAHIERDTCLPLTAEKGFFDLIAKNWVPSISLDADEAMNLAERTCSGNLGALLLQGPEVTDPRFETLVRVEPVRALRRVCRRALDDAGLVDSDVNDNSRQAIGPIAAALRAYRIAVRGLLPAATLGNKLSLVWVSCLADDAEERATEDVIVAKSARLAITDSNVSVAIVYPKPKEPGRKVFRPTSLDGVNQQFFWPVSDCSAPFGMTAPDGNPEAGEPEAVHHAIILTNPEFFVLISP